MLDKAAVAVGGGLTHRLHRADALMLKENDLASTAEEGDEGDDEYGDDGGGDDVDDADDNHEFDEDYYVW